MHKTKLNMVHCFIVMSDKMYFIQLSKGQVCDKWIIVIICCYPTGNVILPTIVQVISYQTN